MAAERGFSGGFARYTKYTSEPKEAEIQTMRELLAVLAEARTKVEIEVYDADGHRHVITASYLGERSL